MKGFHRHSSQDFVEASMGAVRAHDSPGRPREWSWRGGGYFRTRNDLGPLPEKLLTEIPSVGT